MPDSRPLRIHLVCSAGPLMHTSIGGLVFSPFGAEHMDAEVLVDNIHNSLKKVALVNRCISNHKILSLHLM
jgi:hypothetical protein